MSLNPTRVGLSPSAMELPENVKERFSALGSKLKVGGAEVGRKVTQRMNSVGGKMKEIFQGPTLAGRLVEEATAENLRSPDWVKFMEICDSLNDGRLSGQDVVRAIKKRIMSRNAGVQLLALTLLETCLKNYEKMFSEMASERLVDEMAKAAEDPQTWSRCRDKILSLIEAWGESTEELRYLPVFEDTYKSMRARGVRFPGRDTTSLVPIFTPPAKTFVDPSTPQARSPTMVNMNSMTARETLDVAKNSTEILSTVLASSPSQEVVKGELTLSLVEQCKQAQVRTQRIAQTAGDNDALLFEALTVNDELQQVLSKFEQMSAPEQQNKPAEEPAVVTAVVVNDQPAEAVKHRLSKSSNRSSSQSYDPLSDLEDD